MGRACLEALILRKFRQTLRASRLPRGARIVVGHGASTCSTVLTELLARSVQSDDALSVTVVSAGDVPVQTMPRDWTHCSIPVRDDERQGLCGNDVFEWRRGRVLRELIDKAHYDNAVAVLLGDCSDRIACEMLSCIATKGRALGAVERSQPLCDVDGIRVIRPMIHLTRQQIHAWCRHRGLAIREPDTGLSGVRQMTSEFLCRLQATFPACVSNIIRTSAKLERPKSSTPCRRCFDPLPDSASTVCPACTHQGIDLPMNTDDPR